MLMAWLSSRGAYITNGSCLVSLQESAYRCRALSRQTALSDSNIDLLNREPAWRRREKSAKLTRIDNRRHKHDSTAAFDDKMQPISRYEFKMEPNRFRDRDLSFTGDGSGWHTLLPSDFCGPHLMVFHPIEPRSCASPAAAACLRPQAGRGRHATYPVSRVPGEGASCNSLVHPPSRIIGYQMARCCGRSTSRAIHNRNSRSSRKAPPGFAFGRASR